ncbi:gas vesicle protein GvpL [Halorarum halobium]|uniref:gas vesicle protein GvpL n=1 Tax=Halorarum halobium TaxID=3075121 RepID=UPI0028AE16D1|nr:GvpL/GvpF family gas vesicle protein [Halobaculum sp. XH14]
MTEVGFAEGRYLYCVVDASGPGAERDGERADREGVDAAREFSPEGIEGGEPYVVGSDGVGAVVQPRGEPFDSDDLRRVKRWLLAHQRVVDAAGQAFGTPLPFRFDTIHEGDDDAVREWLRSERDALRANLDAFAGKWEYRVTLTVDGEFDPDDEELSDLRARIDAAGEGEAFLLEKQYERRLTDLERERDDRLAADLRERLAPLVADVEPVESGGVLDEGPAGNRVTGLALLAQREQESAIGSELDEVVADPDLDVEFTGPWPPYSFAPELGGSG